MAMEGFGRGRCYRRCSQLLRLARLTIGASRECKQHLARALEVAAPQQRGTLASKAICVISRDALIGDDHAPGRRRTTLRAPARGALLAILCPTNDRMSAEAGARYIHWHSR